MEKKNPIEEAQRYVDNARVLLQERGELDYETQSYQDRKYVKMAGNTLWNGVLLILNATFHISKAKGRRLSMDDYRNMVDRWRDHRPLCDDAYCLTSRWVCVMLSERVFRR